MWKNICFLFLVFFCGCQYINPIGPIVSLGIYWYEGEANKYYNTDQATLLRATKQALAELDLKVTDETRNEKTVYVTAGDRDRFHIKVTMIRPQTTKLSIRVNVFGDKPYAEMIYRHVDQKPGVKTYQNLQVLNRDVR